MRKTLFFTLFLFAGPCFAQSADSSFHLQATAVSQEHGDFPARYSGQNSLSNSVDQQTSLTWTLFAGWHIWQGGEFYIDPEMAGGSGFNKTLGMAGFPNGEIYRVDDPSPKWNLARLFFKQVFGLGGGEEKIADDKNQIAATVDRNRQTFVIGRFALNDFFDTNSYSHDPRTQFLNWALMDYGAWDYAADTRGYSWGLSYELKDGAWSFRLASVLVPVYANQMQLSLNYPQNRGDNAELEYRYSMHDEPGVLRFLAYENHANMGNYRTTLSTPAYGLDVTQSRSMSAKYGFGLSLEQALPNSLGAFARLSWNDGHTETWAFTEIDRSLTIGLNAAGKLWNREHDNAGLALIANGISDDHRDYLSAGGYGFIIGDGQLSYAPEEIAELYYLWRAFNTIDFSGDYQFVENPAYNLDRGPVSIFSMRIHYEI